MARIHEAIIQVMQEVGAIGKNSRNSQQGYAYRSADDVYNAVAPLMAKYGICSAPCVVEEAHETGTSNRGGTLHYTRLIVKYTFFASDGTSVECTVASEGMDSGDKATPKAMTVAHRYAICQLFVIPVADVTIDSERDSHEYRPPKNRPQQTQATTPPADKPETPSLTDAETEYVTECSQWIADAVDMPTLKGIFDKIAGKSQSVKDALKPLCVKRNAELKAELTPQENDA